VVGNYDGTPTTGENLMEGVQRFLKVGKVLIKQRMDFLWKKKYRVDVVIANDHHNALLLVDHCQRAMFELATQDALTVHVR
jgi:hypothetical protein